MTSGQSPEQMMGVEDLAMSEEGAGSNNQEELAAAVSWEAARWSLVGRRSAQRRRL